MGSYTRPNNQGVGNFYTDAQQTVEESTRKYINDQIIDTDIGNTLTGENIAKGSYNIINNSHSFETGGISHRQDLHRVNNFSYQTSTTKNNSQTSSIQFQDVANSGVTVTNAAGGDAVITLYLYYEVTPNPTTNVADNDGPGAGLWYNQVILKYINRTSGQVGLLTNNSDTYVFNGSGSVVDTLDPGEGGEPASRRPIMLQYHISISSGEWSFVASVNPHNETAKATVKGMTVEVFDI